MILPLHASFEALPFPGSTELHPKVNRYGMFCSKGPDLWE